MSEDGLLASWTQRKRVTEEPEPEPEHVAAPADPFEGKTDAEILEARGLPEPESIVDGEGARAFLTAAVPQHLRNRALRTLWRSNPTLANLDALVDYGEDFTDAAMVPEVLTTAYKVGKGIIRDLAEAEPTAEDEEAEDEEVAAEETPDVPEPDTPPDPPPTESVEIAAAPQIEDAPQQILRPRRMRISYDA